MKFLLALILLVVSCGYNSYKYETTFSSAETWGATRSRAVDNLTRRGYRIEELGYDSLQTKWRFIRIYPQEYNETWFGLRIRIAMDRAGKVTGECMQKVYGSVRARRGHREPIWVPCKDDDLLNMLRWAVDDITRELSR